MSIFVCSRIHPSVQNFGRQTHVFALFNGFQKDLQYVVLSGAKAFLAPHASQGEKPGIATTSAMCLGVEQPVFVSKEIPRWIELDTAEIAKIGLEEWRRRLNRRERSALSRPDSS